MLKTTTDRIEFIGSNQQTIAGKIDKPVGPIRAYALFAHCFTCTKDFIGTRYITEALASNGIAVLRFDFAGLGASSGDFAETNFRTNVQDLISAADYMEKQLKAPALLIGHSLGGAAVLAACKKIESVEAVITIAAPADADHVIHNFETHVDEIEREGSAEVSLAGRKHTITKQFLDDLRAQNIIEGLDEVRKAFLIMHSPSDDTVGIENAARIFAAAKHPKSFVTLDEADHLLTNGEDATYIASVIRTWADRYLSCPQLEDVEGEGQVIVSETGSSKFQNWVQTGAHEFMADEPKKYGGTDTGPTPYNLLSAALGTCTAMTLRMYADRKDLSLDRVTVEVDHNKIHGVDCETCEEGTTGKVDQFERRIRLDGELDEKTRERLLEIADRCPVHRTLESTINIVTSLKS